MWSRAVRGVAAALVLASLAGCGPSIRVRTDFDPQHDFAAYRTYAWAPLPQTGDPRLDNPLLQRRIHAAIEGALAERGYRVATSGEPDFYVGYFPVVDQQVDVQTVDRFYGWGRASWYGPRGGVVRETTARVYNQGTLIVDVADRATKQIVWRGSAQAEVHEDLSPEERQQRLNEVARRILADFPPAPGNPGK